MHEITLAMSLVDQLIGVMHERGASRVVTATVEIGALSGVDANALAFAFPSAARDTPVEGTQLFLEHVSACGHCRDCGHKQELDTMFHLCERCGGTRLDMVAGNELILKSADLRMQD